MNGQYFMSLNTGKIHSKHWDQIPIVEFVIDKVKELATKEEQHTIKNKCILFKWGVGIEIEDINIEDNSDIIEQNQVELNESIDIREDLIDQTIITDDDLDISLSDDQESSVEQNNDIIALSSIDEDNSSKNTEKDDDIDEDLSKIDETNNGEKLHYNKTYDLTEALPLEHYEENDSDINENDEHSSTHQSLDEDRDQQDELLEKDKNEGAYRRSNLRPSRSNAGNGVEKLNMTFKGKHYPSITKKQLLI